MNKEEFDEKLINAVQLAPILYDVTPVSYKNNSVRQKIWNTIADELGSTSKICQQRWKNIRYTYLTSIRENKQPSGSGRKRKIYSCDLSFLNKFAVQSKPTCSNLEIEFVSDPTDIDDDIIVSDTIDYSLQSSMNSSFSSNSSTEKSTPKRRSTSANNEIITEINTVLNSLNTCKADAEEAYGQTVADALRDMDRKEKERVKFEIAKILKDATYKT